MEVIYGDKTYDRHALACGVCIAKKEGIQKRHKSRCKFYRKDKNRCLAFASKCTGSGYCSRYSELTEKEKAIKEDVRRKALFYKEATPFKGKSVFEPSKEQNSTKKRKK